LCIGLNCDVDYALKHIPGTFASTWRKWQLNNSNIKWQLFNICCLYVFYYYHILSYSL